ncbi:hypothetical protein AB0O18_05120 [Streptomyces sp. NPDC093224]|uniref:hypothetical protein n=1 Tax=Streptomyces sp. NPDC093224 TaxID=3155198 RepID=UPI0034483158
MVDSPNRGAAHGLSGVPATLLTPLYGRAHAARLVPGTSFRDPLAEDLIARTGHRAGEVLTDRSNAAGAVHRAVVLDALTAAFTARHPDAVVLSAGIGLDTRADRLAGRTPSTVLKHAVMERIGTAHRLAAGLFRAVTLGARPYAVAHLRAGGGASR